MALITTNNLMVGDLSSMVTSLYTLKSDQSIYLPQPNSKFESTDYRERVAHVLGLDYQGLQVKINRGEIEDKTGLMTIDHETGKDISWRDENPNAVF